MLFALLAVEMGIRSEAGDAGDDAVFAAIEEAKQQPAAPILVNPNSAERFGTLWLNLSDRASAKILAQAVDSARGQRLEIRMIAFGDDPAIIAKTMLFHMVAEKNKLSQQPSRLAMLVEELRDGNYLALADHYSEIPPCMRVAARNRIDVDLRDAQRILVRLDRTRLVSQ